MRISDWSSDVCSSDLTRILEMERGGLGYIIIAIEVDPDHIVPVDLAHLVKDAIAQTAGIVHHRVELAEGAQGIFDDAGGSGGVRNICGVDDRLPARGADFRADLLGWPGGAALASLAPEARRGGKACVIRCRP